MTSCQPSKIVLQGNAGNKTRTLDTNMIHLPSCQMIRYKPVPLPPPMNIQTCPPPVIQRNKPACQTLPGSL